MLHTIHFISKSLHKPTKKLLFDQQNLNEQNHTQRLETFTTLQLKTIHPILQHKNDKACYATVSYS